ncbi:MAG: deoxyribodipyrimidine photo-lyase [Pseudomonadota bacterium]
MIPDDFVAALDPFPTLMDRIHVMAERPVRRPARYVLCWIQQALRCDQNPLVEAAQAIGNALGLPVLVYHGISQTYPHASDRLHWMLLGGSREMARGLSERGIRTVCHVVRPGHVEKGLVYRLADHAACVVLEDHPTFVASWQSRSFAAKADCPVLAVDAARLVPYRTLPAGLRTTKAFRKASGERRASYLDGIPRTEVPCPPYDGPLPFTPTQIEEADDASLSTLMKACDIDHSLPVCEAHPPSRKVALNRMERFVAQSLARYKWERNNPASPHAGSELSPYLHFGMIAPWEVAAAVRASNVHAAAKWKFLDELLTWREWFHYQALHMPGFERFETLAARPRDSLLAHADDPRETLYSMDELLHGRTEDETWNAAQRQWLLDGYMHNNLRMYWGKKLIGWTPDPETAWNVACYINDRISLDGRDPATYGNMRWCFGDARPAYREAAVYGWVAPKTDRALRKRTGVPEWLSRMASREGPRIDAPNAYPDAPRPSLD